VQPIVESRLARWPPIDTTLALAEVLSTLPFVGMNKRNAFGVLQYLFNVSAHRETSEGAKSANLI
jgi:hypothetical protein